MKRALTVSLLMEPSIFIPHFLRACLFALLPEKDSYRNIKIARGKRGGITPNLQLYFQASQLNYLANWAQRKIDTGYQRAAWMSSTVELHGKLCSLAAVTLPPACSASWPWLGNPPALRWCRSFSSPGLSVRSWKHEHAEHISFLEPGRGLLQAPNPTF